jgi:hypothetical protein
MCVIVIDSAKENLLVCTGIDSSCSKVNVEVEEEDDLFSFLERNLGQGKLYPGGTLCAFKNKKYYVW